MPASLVPSLCRMTSTRRRFSSAQGALGHACASGGGPCVPPRASCTPVPCSSAERCWAGLELCLQASSLLLPAVAAGLTTA